MTQVIIVEDERLSAERLEHLIRKTDPDIEIIARLDSYHAALDWYRDNSPPDLMFLDIQLGDGTGIDFLKETEAKTPVIFTTAYDEFAIKAFKFNSLSYLLKPIEEGDLKESLEKFKSISFQPSDNQIDNTRKILNEDFKKRFLVKLGDQYKSINTMDVAFFIYQQSMCSVVTKNGEKWPMDQTMEQVESLVSPIDFFRVNRKLLVTIEAIAEIHSYFNSRLILRLNPSLDEDVIVSRERVADFKRWMDL